MKYAKNLFVFFFLIISSTIFADGDENARIALEMCFDLKNPDAGFICTKMLLDKYKQDKTNYNVLIECMTLCCVSNRHLKDAAENADEVIKTSSNLFYIGCAWLQKGRHAISNNEYQDAVTYLTIALKAIEKSTETAERNDGMFSTHEVYEGICHAIRMCAYQKLGESEKAKEDEEFINNMEKKANLSNSRLQESE